MRKVAHSPITAATKGLVPAVSDGWLHLAREQNQLSEVH